MTYKLKAYNVFDGALNPAHSLTHSLTQQMQAWRYNNDVTSTDA